MANQGLCFVTSKYQSNVIFFIYFAIVSSFLALASNCTFFASRPKSETWKHPSTVSWLRVTSYGAGGGFFYSLMARQCPADINKLFMPSHSREQVSTRRKYHINIFGIGMNYTTFDVF